MPYEVIQLAPNIVRINMSGHVDKATADIYYPEAWQQLDQCPRPTSILMDARDVASVCPKARDVVDKVRFHPNVGIIAFLVRNRYMLLFSPVVQIFSGLRMYGSEEEALSFLYRHSGVPMPTATTSPVVGAAVPIYRPPDPAPAPPADAPAKKKSGFALPPIFALSFLHNHQKPQPAEPQPVKLVVPPRKQGFNPITDTLTFFTDMLEGMTRNVEEVNAPE